MPKGYQDSGSVPVAVPVGLPCYGHQSVDFSFRQILSGTTWRSVIFEPIVGSADAFASYVRAEQARWSKILADNKLSAEWGINGLDDCCVNSHSGLIPACFTTVPQRADSLRMKASKSSGMPP